MEIHSVLPDERAKDENNNVLPWGYRYLESVSPLSLRLVADKKTDLYTAPRRIRGSLLRRVAHLDDIEAHLATREAIEHLEPVREPHRFER